MSWLGKVTLTFGMEDAENTNGIGSLNDPIAHGVLLESLESDTANVPGSMLISAAESN